VKRSPKYLVVFRRNDLIGTEEYDGGTTLSEARAEAKFFCANLPSHVSVRVCTVDPIGRLYTEEIVRLDHAGAN
jgi:hypothetical protein